MLQTWIVPNNLWKYPKNAIKSKNLPYHAVSFGILIYHNVYINQWHILWKFGEYTILQTRIVVNSVWKLLKNAMKSHNLQLNQHIKMCLLIRHTFCKSLIKICVTKHKCPSFLWYYFRYRSVCCRPAQKNSLENQKSSYVSKISNKIWYF